MIYTIAPCDHHSLDASTIGRSMSQNIRHSETVSSSSSSTDVDAASTRETSDHSTSSRRWPVVERR
jgi:hypothetical protein